MTTAVELLDLTIRQLSKRIRHSACHCQQRAISLDETLIR